MTSQIKTKKNGPDIVINIIGYFLDIDDKQLEIVGDINKAEGKIYINLNEMSPLDIDHIMDWKNWMTSLPEEKSYTFTHLPYFFVGLINTATEILPANSIIESFYAPFYCPCCDKKENILIKTEETKSSSFISSIQNKICEHCQTKNTLLVHPSTYFRFLDCSDFERYKVYEEFMDGIVVFDTQKKIIYCNQAAAMLANVDRAEILEKGLHFYDLFKFSQQQNFTFQEEFSKYQKFIYEKLFFHTKDNQEATLQIGFSNETGSFELRKRHLAHIRDVTSEITLISDKRHKEQKLHDTLGQLDKISHMARTDAMTGLPNYRSFTHELEKKLSYCKRYKVPLALILIDLDYFKLVNDTYGHQQGDETLRKVARVLEQSTRSSDFVARYGGEEFIMLFLHVEKSDLEKIAANILSSVEHLKIPNISSDDPPTLSITTSLGGICLNPKQWNGENQNLFIEEADKNLYRAKNAGRNCYIIT